MKVKFSDPRWFQLLFLVLFISIGFFFRDFSLNFWQVFLALTASLLTQAFWKRVYKIKNLSYLSAVISACGLSLLLRSDNLWIHPLMMIVANSAKFNLRWNEKHIFNPANLGVAMGALFFNGTWISPGQWGHSWLLIALIATLGFFVSKKAKSLNISLYFLASWIVFVSIREAYLGYTWTHWLHQFENGALILFTFFMISDPKTIPYANWARGLLAFSVALFAFIWQFGFYKYNGPIWGLFFLSFLTPLLDRIEKYRFQTLRVWTGQRT